MKYYKKRRQFNTHLNIKYLVNRDSKLNINFCQTLLFYSSIVVSMVIRIVKHVSMCNKLILVLIYTLTKVSCSYLIDKFHNLLNRSHFNLRIFQEMSKVLRHHTILLMLNKHDWSREPIGTKSIQI